MRKINDTQKMKKFLEKNDGKDIIDYVEENIPYKRGKTISMKYDREGNKFHLEEQIGKFGYHGHGSYGDGNRRDRINEGDVLIKKDEDGYELNLLVVAVKYKEEPKDEFEAVTIAIKNQ